MQHTQQLEAIRAVVSETFDEYSPNDADFCESVLVRDGFYCGRRFTAQSVRAVWFAEDNVVKFYGKDGHFLVARHMDGVLDRGRRQAA